ncbi:unnamed protein product, partial [marine sediment metagenome]
DHPVVLKLIEFVGGPITATSANLSGKSAPITIREALEQLGKRVDVALDSGKCKLGTPSTVVDFSSGLPRVLREGPISKKDHLFPKRGKIGILAAGTADVPV